MKRLLHFPRDFLRGVRHAGRGYFFPELATKDGNLKLPPALFLDSVWRASPGGRMKLFRRLLPYLSARTPASSSEVCEINSLAEFETGYARLAAMLGQAGKIPPPGEVEFLRTMVNRPMHHPGTIEASDYFFLTAFVSILAPQRVIEIGTLTGFSAALIAATIHRQHGNNDGAGLPSGRREIGVDTIDLFPQCFIDETRPTGFEIAESFPELASMIRLHIPHDSTVISELAAPDELEVAFIDANHQHPFPLLDLLRLAPYMKPGSWIVLHDILLGTMGRKAKGADPTLRWGAVEGAEWLFESWPFRKISGGNIGAVQLPDERSALIPFALRLMSRPYEIKGSSALGADRALHLSFNALV